MTSIPERRARILALIVDDYVGSATPVGSQSLVQRHGLGLSSATVRNEMAALEDEGLITHPHTSAGRVPSDRGYRYYVSSLMRESNLTAQDRFTILHQFHQSARELENWVGLAASVLANSLHNLAIVGQPRIREVRLKQLQLVELADNRALLIVVTNDAAVHQHALEFPQAMSQEALSRLANRLNAELGGKTAAELTPSERAEALTPIEAVVIARVAELLLREAGGFADPPIIEGIREMLRQPEFEDSDRLLDTLEAVDERHLTRAIPSDALAAGDVAIVIGDENREGPYKDMSFVLARYGPSTGAGGVLGVLGPTRMSYPDAVAHVRYVADVLTGLMRDFYGEE